MSEFGGDIQSVKFGNSGVGVAVHGTDASGFVEFYDGEDQDHMETMAQGRPIYKTMPFLRLMFPGDKNKIIERPVKMESDGQSPADPLRWPGAWDRYQKGSHQTHDGLPLGQWIMASAADVRNLQGANVYTVEQLASVTDANLSSLGHGARNLRDKAVAFLAQAGDAEIAQVVNAQIEQVRGENSALTSALESANARIEALEKAMSEPRAASLNPPAEQLQSIKPIKKR